MLLKRFFVFFAMVISSCTSGSTRVDSAVGTRGTAQEIDDILAERKYTVELAYEGCFGGGMETLEVRDKKIAIYTFPVFGEADKVKEKMDTLPWTSEKEVALRGCLSPVFNLAIRWGIVLRRLNINWRARRSL